MAKKSKKVEKETRKLMESIADLVKQKGDRYKFKSKKNKKQIKKVKKTCVHWIINKKGKEQPTLIHDPDNPNNWKCMICGASFPVLPEEPNVYHDQVDKVLASVNQMQFLSVKLGGDAEDTKMFIELKRDLPRFRKVTEQILKQINKRQEWETNRERSNALSQFDSHSGFNFRV